VPYHHKDHVWTNEQFDNINEKEWKKDAPKLAQHQDGTH